MGKKDFMKKYSNAVLELYNIPSAEEINALPDSDADDKEDVEINLKDTDVESEMEVDEELNP